MTSSEKTQLKDSIDPEHYTRKRAAQRTNSGADHRIAAALEHIADDLSAMRYLLLLIQSKMK